MMEPTPVLDRKSLGAEDGQLSQPWHERRFEVLVLLLLAVHVVLAWLRRPRGIRTGQDDAIYIMLARSLRNGGYNDLYLVGEPFHHLYPPAYPALLAVFGSLFGEGFLLFQAAGISAMTAALAIFALTVRRLWSPGIALACLAPLAVNPHLVMTAGGIATDSTYLLASMIALALLARSTTDHGMLVLAACAAILAALTRSVGVTLILATGGFWLLQRRFTAFAALAAASTLTVGLWLIWTVLAPEQYAGRSYIADAAFAPTGSEASFVRVLLSRFVANIGSYLGTHIPNRIGVPELPLPTLPAAVLSGMVCVAIALGLPELWKRWNVLAVYLAFYLALLAAWPWSLGRFLNVIIPFLVLAAMVGCSVVAQRIAGLRRARMLHFAALTLVLLGCLRIGLHLTTQNWCAWGAELPPHECRRGVIGAFFNALEYVDQELPQNAGVFSAKGAPLFFFTGRQTIPLGRITSQSDSSLVQFLTGQDLGYIVLGSVHATERRVIGPRLEANCTRLRLLASFEPATHVLEVLPAGEEADGSACAALAAYNRPEG
jgi:hypothetical protein